jgi:hypothetical protein
MQAQARPHNPTVKHYCFIQLPVALLLLTYLSTTPSTV